MYKHGLLFDATNQLRLSSWGFSALLKGSSVVTAEEEGVIYSLSTATLSQLV